MMDISKAALPPVQPGISDEDRRHPMFQRYQAYRSSMSRQLVEASSFKDWLGQVESYEYLRSFDAHPRYAEFQKWMRDTQAGGRKCPAGVFPENFKYWLTGARW